MILIELQAAIDAAGTLQTFYASAGAFVTTRTDTPADVAFLDTVIKPGSLGVSVFGDGRTGGGTRLETGEVILANADGQYDSWINYGFDGRPIIIRSGEPGAAYPAGFATIFKGTVEGIEATFTQLIVRIKDAQFIFDRPAQTLRYAGTNALPNGLEGTPTDIKGKVKPRTLGKVFQVTPAFINTSKLTFQVNTGAVSDIPAVYDQGVLITKGADYANSTLLQAAAPGGGTYITCFAEGMFRLGTTPVGQITADVTQGASAAARTAAQLLKQLAIDAGATVSAADVTALDAANSSVVGIYIDDEKTFQQAMDEVARSVGAYYFLDATSVLRMGRLVSPPGSPACTIQTRDILGIEHRPLRDIDIPIYSATVNHTKLWTVQTSDYAGAVTAATRAYMALEYRAEVATDVTIKQQFLQAGEATFDTLLTSAADAATEAARLLALYKVHRDCFDVTVPLSLLSTYSLQLVTDVFLQLPRFGLASGKDFVILGIKTEFARSQVVLTLWG